MQHSQSAMKILPSDLLERLSDRGYTVVGVIRKQGTQSWEVLTAFNVHKDGRTHQVNRKQLEAMSQKEMKNGKV